MSEPPPGLTGVIVMLAWWLKWLMVKSFFPPSVDISIVALSVPGQIHRLWCDVLKRKIKEVSWDTALMCAALEKGQDLHLLSWVVAPNLSHFSLCDLLQIHHIWPNSHSFLLRSHQKIKSSYWLPHIKYVISLLLTLFIQIDFVLVLCGLTFYFLPLCLIFPLYFSHSLTFVYFSVQLQKKDEKTFFFNSDMSLSFLNSNLEHRCTCEEFGDTVVILILCPMFFQVVTSPPPSIHPDLHRLYKSEKSPPVRGWFRGGSNSALCYADFL